MRARLAALLLCAGIVMGVPANAEVMVGMASVDFGRVTKWDGGNFHGRVATGERYKTAALAVAHRTLPLNSCVAVQHRRKIETARVNDRGPCLTPHCQKVAPARVKARVLDMTPALAAKLRCDGLCKVTFWPVKCDG